ncbi:MAG: ATP-grasp domain-containing protein [Candidatus Geothermarchaeales archaeon]
MKRILITGSGGSAGIGFTRCLKSAPEEFFMVGSDCDPTYIHFAETDVKTLIPRSDAPNYIDTLNEIAQRFNLEFLHAQPDPEIRVISKNRGRLNVNILLPRERTIEICADKFKTNEVLARKDVPVPRTKLLRNRRDLEEAFNEIHPTLWIRMKRGAGGKGSLKVSQEDIKLAESWVDYWRGWGNFVASEYLPGANFGWDAIFKDGDLVKSHAKERLRYALAGASPSGITGTAGVAKSIKREDVNETALNAVHGVDDNPHGVFSVDLKESGEGIPHVTEINAGRFLTSSLHFFYAMNLNLPYVYVRLAYGLEVKPQLYGREITPNTILARSLDSEPITLPEGEVQRLMEERRERGYVVIK